MFKDKLMLAPLAGVNDIAFRILCKKYGADIVYTGMVNATALVRKNKATFRLAETVEGERPIAIQIFGYNEKTMAKAAKMVENSADFIDINMGCPDRDVIKQGAGAALLKKPAKVEKIVKAVKGAISIPLSVKIRSGYDRQILADTLKIAKIIEVSGADMITVHPRTVKQGYSGTADWSVIKAVKDAVSIPVVGNGDVRSFEDYNRMKNVTGCDSVMIGRAAMRNPMIFQDVKSSKVSEITRENRIALLREYLELADEYGIFDYIPLRGRSQMILSGFNGSTALRGQIGKLKSDRELSAFLRELL